MKLTVVLKVGEDIMRNSTFEKSEEQGWLQFLNELASGFPGGRLGLVASLIMMTAGGKWGYDTGEGLDPFWRNANMMSGMLLGLVISISPSMLYGLFSASRADNASRTPVPAELPLKKAG